MAVLHKALSERRYNQCLILLRSGTDVDYQDQRGRTALMKCCWVTELRSAFTVAKALLQAGADAKVKDLQGRTVLHHAVLQDRTAIVRLLLRTGDVDVNEKDRHGDSALHMAASRGQYGVVGHLVGYLRRYDVTVDVRDGEGMTALMLACAGGHLDTARLLVRQGRASITMQDDIYHRNAEQWLGMVYEVPPDVDPFMDSVKLELRYQDTEPPKTSRVQSASIRLVSMQHGNPICRAASAPAKRKPSSSNRNNVLSNRFSVPDITNGYYDKKSSRVSSRSGAYSFRTSTHRSKSSVHDNKFFDNSFVNCTNANNSHLSKAYTNGWQNCTSHDGSSESTHPDKLLDLYQVFTVQNSPSYRPSAYKPPTPPPTPPPPPDSPEDSPKLSAKGKLQKFLRQKRAESIVQALTSQGRKNRSVSVMVPHSERKEHFENAVLASFKRRATRASPLTQVDSSLLEKLRGRRTSRAMQRQKSPRGSQESLCSISPVPEAQETSRFLESIKKVQRTRKLRLEQLEESSDVSDSPPEDE